MARPQDRVEAIIEEERKVENFKDMVTLLSSLDAKVRILGSPCG
jgi:hypothetical protein